MYTTGILPHFLIKSKDEKEVYTFKKLFVIE